jgi:hypothetical protein
VVVHTCNPRTQEIETGLSQVHRQVGLPSESLSLSKISKFNNKTKTKSDMRSSSQDLKSSEKVFALHPCH